MTSRRAEELFFLSKPCFKEHVYRLRSDATRYLKTLRFVCESGTIELVSNGVKARVLAALHVTHQHEMVSFFLKHCEIIDIAKAIQILDRNRQIRQLSQRIEKIEGKYPHLIVDVEEENAFHSNSKKTRTNKRSDGKSRKKMRKIDLYRKAKCTLASMDSCPGSSSCSDAHKDSATTELVQSSSVSGALAKKIQNWAKTCVRKDFLEFVLLALPLDSWKQVADMIHFTPSDFALSYFLESLFCDEKCSAIRDNFVSNMNSFLKESNKFYRSEQFNTIAQNFPQVYMNYSLVRRYGEVISNPEIMEKFAANASLDTVIWNFEEFHRASRACETIVQKRIEYKGEDLQLANRKITYGKLVERILTLRRMGVRFADDLLPLADASLEELRSCWKGENLNRKVAVFGDASSSMQSAIEAATIFSSMVSVCFEGELSFFSSDLVASPHKRPANVHETIEVCRKVKACGCTSLAAALWPYFENKIIVDMFVMVTDEYENSPKNGYDFAELLSEYKQEVNPDVVLVIVCVGKGDTQFRNSLLRNDIESKLVEVDGARPDHSKFDALLGQLALLSQHGLIDEIEDPLVDNREGKEDHADFVIV